MSNTKPLESIQIKKSGFQNLFVIVSNETRNESKIDTDIKKTKNEGHEEITSNRQFNMRRSSSSSTTTAATTAATSTSKRSSSNYGDVTYQAPKFKFLANFADGGSGLYDFSKRDWDFYRGQGHLETIFDCKFSLKNPDILATASYDGTVKTWSVSSMNVVDSTPPPPSMQNGEIIYSISWAPSTSSLNCIVASKSKTGCFIWDLDKKAIISTFQDSDSPTYCVAWNQRDAKKIASGGADNFW